MEQPKLPLAEAWDDPLSEEELEEIQLAYEFWLEGDVGSLMALTKFPFLSYKPHVRVVNSQDRLLPQDELPA